MKLFGARVTLDRVTPEVAQRIADRAEDPVGGKPGAGARPRARNHEQ